jgi:hypothetical protein
VAINNDFCPAEEIVLCGMADRFGKGGQDRHVWMENSKQSRS